MCYRNSKSWHWHNLEFQGLCNHEYRVIGNIRCLKLQPHYIYIGIYIYIYIYIYIIVPFPSSCQENENFKGGTVAIINDYPISMTGSCI